MSPLPTRAILIVLDGVGVGALPDAAEYGDIGSNTVGNLSRKTGGLNLPTLERMGLGKLTTISGVRAHEPAMGGYGKCAQLSAGKDSISGHWELMGAITERPFPVYPDGFPDRLLARFSEKIGRKVLWGRPASGTEIIKRFGDEHVRTGAPIVYTSADSVFQIAAHEQVIDLHEQYRICRLARELLTGEHAVARVIARPFVGENGQYTRTPNRHDFALPPPENMLDRLTSAGLPVVGIGKIDDLYCHRGVTKVVPTTSNSHGMAAALAELASTPHGLIMINLVQFDQDWGHRNDCDGFKAGLEAFDQWLSGFLQRLAPADLLMISADHGVDPTTPSTDHSREYVPILAYGSGISPGSDFGTRSTCADIGATLAHVFAVEPMAAGTSLITG